jgi:3-hydroxybutyryl-CoA dehydrogenase
MLKPEEHKRAVVIGTGLMGPGIAYTLASTGCRVSLCGRSESSLTRGLRSYHAATDTLLRGGCISEPEAGKARENIAGTLDMEVAVSDADLVIESIAEDLDVKRTLFQRIEACCPSDTLLSSNTSGLPVGQLAGVLNHPGRFAVTHFWNPPHLMPLVEVVKGENTSQETVDAIVALLEQAGKKPVVVLKDTPGQLGNRLFHALLREAIWIVQEGIASAEDVDTAVKTSFGRRFPVYGLLEHQDVVGLDMVLAIQGYMCKALCNHTEAGKLLQEKVSTGARGAKSGHGFYDWTKRDLESTIRQRDEFLLRMLKSEMS